ncbi:MAG: LysE family translocator [Chlamydiae bacterium]|nr:LysE family translocator [Chlamydiota bacterium]
MHPLNFNFLLKGIILGFCIAAPVGPIGLLCIRRTLQYGRLSGLMSGLGAAFADTIYGFIAAFGLTAISNLLLKNQLFLKFFGGCFLIYLGLKTFLSKPAENSNKVFHSNLTSDFVSTFFLTITNPMTILSFVAIFAGVGLSEESENYFNSSFLVSGVFLGSAIWWLILSEVVTFFRKKLSQKVFGWINRIAGLLIALFGLIAIFYSIEQFFK